ncbi:uncharacterized protein YgbK (DUF1537 family) [Evansella vedderi]|uniref:Uncharacterized protein YgbK (DUF1537 family) n=1 Tax=Evansella vedderi TaxID=38282 RepID=A0ABT9ZQX8_9BACI|nr:four-carbon acid sugar kinase family protein [Evansella vedderi]MDQ0253269.1 uncharacterized protein YgbK (DUF1537 family) [Evansella vedderi]
MKERLLLAFYGDDFTGSTDAMEALSSKGLRTVLFLAVPDERMLKQFNDIQCFGIAGTARAKTKKEIQHEITPIYKQLQEINPYFIHYKTCSTFDSSPEIGSIGFAIDLAKKFFKNQLYPVLAAAPQLGRYTVLGQHFARMGETVYRLDRHPVMSQHPITPMLESDLSLHLSKQTESTISPITLLDIQQGEARISQLLTEYSEKCRELVLFDSLQDKDIYTIANVLWNRRKREAQFIVGSSGVEYAFAGIWGEMGLSKKPIQNNAHYPVDELLVVSGSASEITSQQMKRAVANGFHAEKIPHQLFYEDDYPYEFLNKVKALMKEKKRVIIYTADGPTDNSLKETRNYFAQRGIDNSEVGKKIGKDLGKWVRTFLESYPLKRLIVSGGDTSGFVTKELDIYALENISSIAPGAPLCLAYSENSMFDRLEIALKGGQLGGIDFYERVMSC